MQHCMDIVLQHSFVTDEFRCQSFYQAVGMEAVGILLREWGNTAFICDVILTLCDRKIMHA